MVWYDMVWYGKVLWYGRYGMTWYGMVWYGMAYSGMVWYGNNLVYVGMFYCAIVVSTFCILSMVNYLRW